MLVSVKNTKILFIFDSNISNNKSNINFSTKNYRLNYLGIFYA